MIYNLQKRMISAAIVLILSSVGFAATKADGTSSNINSNNSEAVKANIESFNPAGGTLTETLAEANMMDLSQQIGEWMSDGSYWEAENSSELAEQKLAENIETWISDGSYWAVTRHSHRAEAKLTNKIKDWMIDGSYWESNEN